MNSKFSKFKSGFSLIELMVVIVLMLIMTAVLFLNQSKNKAQKDVEVAARQVAAQLRTLQNEALSGKQIGTDIVCDFEFNATSGNTLYSIKYYKDCAGSHSYIGSPQNISLNSGKGNVTISPSVIISFSAPRGEVSADSRITLTSKGDTSKLAYVWVCKSGNIFDTKKSTDGC